MDVILLERVEKLGQMGDLVTVKPGYARNFLIPQNKALRATDANKKVFEERRTQLEADNLERKSEAESAAGKMDGAAVTLIRQAGEAGQLYGSVSARDISAALTDAGYTVSRTQIALNKPIKTVGLFPIDVKLHPEVSVQVSANVARSAEEAEIQLKTGKAVISSTAEAEAEAEAEADAETEAAAQDLEALFEEGAAPVLDGESAEDAEAGAETEAASGSAADAEGGETPAETKA